MQRWVEAAHWSGDTGDRQPFVRDRVGRLKRPKVPEQFVGRIVLHIGHRVRQGASVKKHLPSRTNLLPDFAEQGAHRYSIPLLAKCYSLADPHHNRVGFRHHGLQW